MTLQWIKRVLPFLMIGFTSCSFTNMTGSPTATAVGAGAGAGLAALANSNSFTIGLAGLTGGAVGYYFTSLTNDAEGLIKAGGQVYTLGDFVTIVIPTDTIFDTNSDDLLYPEADTVLDSALDVINRFPNQNLLISGNTSGFATRCIEKEISLARARRVASYFWAHGVSVFKFQSLGTRRLIYVGFGDYFPIANHIKALGIRQNSRIQITLFPSYVDLHGKCEVFNNFGASDPVNPNFKDRSANEGNRFGLDRMADDAGAP